MLANRMPIRSALVLAALGASPWLASSCGEAPPTPRAALGRPPMTAADGEVMGVGNEIPVNEYLGQSVSVTIRPELGEAVVVELAPGWYLEQNGLRFEPGDRIRAEGVMRTREGALVARSVRKGNTTVLLRNAAGEPLWETGDSGTR